MNAGVVHENRKSREQFGGGSDERENVIATAHVGHLRADPLSWAGEAFELEPRTLEMFGLAGADEYVGALADKGTGDLEPEPLAAPGDEGASPC
jgi:hypothetical protein